MIATRSATRRQKLQTTTVELAELDEPKPDIAKAKAGTGVDKEDPEMFKTPPKRPPHDGKRKSSRPLTVPRFQDGTGPRKRRTSDWSPSTPTTALGELNLDDETNENRRESSGLFDDLDDLDLFTPLTQPPSTQERFRAATEPRKRMRRTTFGSTPKSASKSVRKPRKAMNPWDKAMKKNPDFAKWVEDYSKQLERAESTELNVIEEPRHESMRDVSDWLNKTF